MKLRRRRGATLGLVAVIVLVIAILGIGFFFLSKIMGGGREVANATDAGAMNVAKRALMEPNVPAPANDEFDGLGVDAATGIPNYSGTINLLAYNRAVGRALLVALNARAIGPASSRLAGDVIDKLDSLGTNLQRQLSGGGLLPGYFDTMARAQNVKMMGPTSDVRLSGAITPAWTIAQGSEGNQKTNVYINQQVIDMMDNPTVSSLYNTTTVSSANVVSKGSWPQGPFSSSASHKFIRAYDRNLTLSNYLDKPILGAAVGPQDRSHLVSSGQFDRCATPVGYAPPNSWKTNSLSQETSKTNTFGGAVACAVVGSLNAEYEACIPRGYVRILNFVSDNNLPGAQPVSGQDVNGGSSIFNNEFWTGPGGSGPTTYAGNGDIFAEQGNGVNGRSRIQAWVDYNNSSITDTTDVNRDNDGKDKRLDPMGPDFSPNSANANASCAPIRSNRGGAQANKFATVAEMKTVRSIGGKCDEDEFGAEGGYHPCRARDDGGEGYVTDMAVNFSRGNTDNGSGANFAEGFTGVEYMKSRVIDTFKTGSRCTGQVRVPNNPATGTPASGMKIAARGGAKNTPQVEVQFANVGNPMELLSHTVSGGGACANDVVAMIHQRCKEILPTATRENVESLLRSQDLPPGATLFIFLPQGSNSLVMQPSLPRTHAAGQDPFTLAAEGTHPNVPTGGCKATPDNNILNYSVNSAKGNGGNPKGDMGIHDQPYTRFSGDNIVSTDIVEWKPSCGARNFLGELSFRNETTGGGEFCKPN